MSRKEEIRKEVERLRGRLSAIERAEELDGIKGIDDHSEQDKAAAFDRLHAKCLEYLEHTAEHGYYPKDGDHYIFELTMTETLGKGAWSIINDAVT